jgi:hypothetical protein
LFATDVVQLARLAVIPRGGVAKLPKEPLKVKTNRKSG